MFWDYASRVKMENYGKTVYFNPSLFDPSTSLSFESEPEGSSLRVEDRVNLIRAGENFPLNQSRARLRVEGLPPPALPHFFPEFFPPRIFFAGPVFAARVRAPCGLAFRPWAAGTSPAVPWNHVAFVAVVAASCQNLPPPFIDRAGNWARTG